MKTSTKKFILIMCDDQFVPPTRFKVLKESNSKQVCLKEFSNTLGALMREFPTGKFTFGLIEKMEEGKFLEGALYGYEELCSISMSKGEKK